MKTFALQLRILSRWDVVEIVLVAGLVFSFLAELRV